MVGGDNATKFQTAFSEMGKPNRQWPFGQETKRIRHNIRKGFLTWEPCAICAIIFRRSWSIQLSHDTLYYNANRSNSSPKRQRGGFNPSFTFLLTRHLRSGLLFPYSLRDQ
jgi:hypothetical protein